MQNIWDVIVIFVGQIRIAADTKRIPILEENGSNFLSSLGPIHILLLIMHVLYQRLNCFIKIRGGISRYNSWRASHMRRGVCLQRTGARARLRRTAATAHGPDEYA